VSDGADRGWTIAEDLDRCPTCGRFVTGENCYSDVEPGGERGADPIVPFCNEACAAPNECRHGVRADAPDCNQCPY